MFSSKELLTIFKRELKTELGVLGYKPFPVNAICFAKELKNGFMGFIGFGTSSLGFYYEQHIDVNYSISNIKLQELKTKLIGLPDKKCYLQGSMRSLSSLIPGSTYNSLEIKVTNPEEIHSAVQTIVGYAEKYINPFFYSNDNWGAYKELVFSGQMASLLLERKKVIPLIYYLEGRKDMGLEYIETRIKKNINHPEKAYGENQLDENFLKNYRMLP